MRLDRVTVTGADDSVSAKDLVDISRDFPFVEWGILCSERHMGGTRFPSRGWLDGLRDVLSANPQVGASCHLCGRWVRDLVFCGSTGFLDGIGKDLFGLFQRVQLNFHAEPHGWNAGMFGATMKSFPGKQWVFQMDGENDYILDEALDKEVNAVPLFDTSGGAGALPQSWPKPLFRSASPVFSPGGPWRFSPRVIWARDIPASVPVLPLYCGYAGGLGPDSLASQLPLIAEAAGDARIWIDMERRVRSEDDSQFMLDKVRKCLEIAVLFVEGWSV